MMNTCIWHPQMKVPTFATLQPNFMRNFQSKLPDLVGQPLMLQHVVAKHRTTDENPHVYCFLKPDYP